MRLKIRFGLGAADKVCAQPGEIRFLPDSEEKGQTRGKILSGNAHRSKRHLVVRRDNALGRGGELLDLIRLYLSFFEKQSAAVQSQDHAFFLPQLNQLLCFFGQTAQLIAFSAAGFGFPPDIIGEKKRYIVQTCGRIAPLRFCFNGSCDEGMRERNKENKQ